MSNNQLHGKKVEEMILKAYMGECKPKNNASWDVPGLFDPSGNNISTSIKTIPNNKKRAEMADARKFISNEESFRLVIAKYEQTGKQKKVTIIEEYIITKDILRSIKGDLTYKHVRGFHDGIQIVRVPDVTKARKRAKDINKVLKKKHSFVLLNPKVDSKKQRRVQCSISLDDLEKLGAVKIVSTNAYHGIKIPFYIDSSKRKF